MILTRWGGALLTATVVLVAPASARSQGPEAVDTAVLQRIREEGLQRSQVMELAGWLTDVYGPRLTGSANERAAAEWALEKFAQWGLANGRLEPWGTVGRGWANEIVVARVIVPQPFQIYVNVAPWTPGTKGTIRGEVVLLDTVETEIQLRRLRGKLRGKFVFLTPPRDVEPRFSPLASRFTEQELGELEHPSRQRGGQPEPSPRVRRGPPPLLSDSAGIAFLRREGVHALITPSGGDGGTMFGGGLAGSPDPRRQWVVLPSVGFALEHYGRIYRMVQRGIAVTLELNVKNRFYDPAPSSNIIAELPGTDSTLQGEVVMLGAHFDSWHYGTGATDNAAGCAVMMEAMRILKTLGPPLRRTVRIALWTGEEQGLRGSVAYVREHFGGLRGQPRTPEHVKFSVYFNLDNGTGAIRGVYLQQNDAVAPVFRAWMEPFKDLGMTTLTREGTGGTDHLAFDAARLPGFQFIQDPIDYDTRTHHSNMDVYERLQAEDLKQNAVIVAAFVYHAATREERIPRKWSS